MSFSNKDVKLYLKKHSHKAESKPSSSVSKKASTKTAIPVRRQPNSFHTPVKRIPVKATIDSLPDEILLKVFSYFGPVDLLNAAVVCKRWYTLARDNLLWQRIYKLYVSKPSTEKQLQSKEQSPEKWKELCVKKCRETRRTKIFPMLKKISPYTGLPARTKDALEKAGVSYSICFEDRDGNEHCLRHNDVYYFHMSVTVRWFDISLPPLNRLRKVRLYASNPVFYYEKGVPVTEGPSQRSLMFEADLNWDAYVRLMTALGSDELIDVYVLPSGLLVATWKDGKDIAFVSANLHAHNLVKRCILGSAHSPYISEPHKVMKDDIDSQYGLHNYACTLELRYMRNSFWSHQQQYLFARRDDIANGLARIVVLDPENESHRSTVTKKLAFLWKTLAFKGSIPNLCILDMTLLDEHRNPMWCVSSCVNVASQHKSEVSYAFDGDKTQLFYEDDKGQVLMQFSWEEDEKTYYMIGCELFLKLSFINQWFGRRY